MIKESRFYEKVQNNAVISSLDPDSIPIESGEISNSGVLRNDEGVLKLLNYGKVILAKSLKDQNALKVAFPGSNVSSNFAEFPELERYNQYLKSNFTNKSFLNVEDIGIELSPEQLVNKCLELSNRSIIFGYTDPFEHMTYIADLIDLDASIDIYIETNGYIKFDPIASYLSKLKSIRITLNSIDPEFHKKHYRWNVKHIKNFIEQVDQAGIHYEIVTRLIPGENSETGVLSRIASYLVHLNVRPLWIFLPFKPMDRLLDTPSTSENQIDLARKVASDYGLISTVQYD